MTDIKFYTTHCAHCQGIALLLKKKNISYEEIYIDQHDPEQVKIITDMGLNSAPVLVVDGVVMDYKTAGNWIREQ